MFRRYALQSALALVAVTALGACATRAHLHHVVHGNAAQAATKTLGKPRTVGVVADALAILEHHGVHRADAAGFRRQLVEQRDDRLLAREGDVQSGKVHALGGTEQVGQEDGGHGGEATQSDRAAQRLADLLGLLLEILEPKTVGTVDEESRIEGRVVIVTGSGRGIGRSIAEGLAQAGAQKEEALAASVQAALSGAIADQAPPRSSFANPLEAADWLTEMSHRLSRRIPDREGRLEFLRAVHYEATRAGLDPQLVLGLIQVESGFKKYAVSSAGARGFMQVMPFWIKVIGRNDDNLFHLRTNLRYGCTILRHYLDRERGDLFRALGRYNGSLGKAEYPDLVLGAWRRHWAAQDDPLRRARLSRSPASSCDSTHPARASC